MKCHNRLSAWCVYHRAPNFTRWETCNWVFYRRSSILILNKFIWELLIWLNTIYIWKLNCLIILLLNQCFLFIALRPTHSCLIISFLSILNFLICFPLVFLRLTILFNLIVLTFSSKWSLYVFFMTKFEEAEDIMQFLTSFPTANHLPICSFFHFFFILFSESC